jgi:mxaJ protein
MNIHSRPKRLSARIRQALLLPVFFAAASVAPAQGRELAVCADPNNLPYSNARLEGFENKIASLIARELQASVRYAWSPLRQGFLRLTLHSGVCDLVVGVSPGLPGVATTRPYYASSYALVYLSNRQSELNHLDAAALRHARIALHAVSVEGTNPPPAAALAARGLQSNVVGYSPWGRQGEESPQGAIIDAVAAGDVDAAFVWGPIAGYFAQRHPGQLLVAPVLSDPKVPSAAFAHEISLGVREGQDAFKAELQGVLDRNTRQIQAILLEYGVPLAQNTWQGATVQTIDHRETTN